MSEVAHSREDCLKSHPPANEKAFLKLSSRFRAAFGFRAAFTPFSIILSSTTMKSAVLTSATLAALTTTVAGTAIAAPRYTSLEFTS